MEYLTGINGKEFDSLVGSVQILEDDKIGFEQGFESHSCGFFNRFDVALFSKVSNFIGHIYFGRVNNVD